MGIRLPRLEELSRDEQIEILNLPLERTYLITGGPGSGKTILALYRAAQLRNKYKDLNITFLVYNKTLHRYLEKALRDLGLDDVSKVKTWHSWFYHYYKERTGASVPEIRPYCPDWETIFKNEIILLKDKFDHLIIDEAQDFPEPLLKILSNMATNASIFADDHQQINDQDYKSGYNKAKIMEIQKIFRAEDRRYHLSRNYRNTEEIYKVGRLFYTGDAHDLSPRIYKKGELPEVIKAGFEEITDFIANYADNNPEKNIGVLIPPKQSCRQTIQKYYKTLKEKCSEASVQYYISNKSFGWNNKKNSENLDFDDDGIKIMTYLSAKGLEFETVFIPEIDDELFDNVDEILLNQLYVCATRAKEHLYFSYENEKSSSFVIKKLKESKTLVEFVKF